MCAKLPSRLIHKQLIILITLHWPCELITVFFPLDFPWWIVLSKCQCIVLSSCQFAGATDMKCTLVLAGTATSLGSIAILVPMLRKKMYFLIKFDTEKTFETLWNLHRFLCINQIIWELFRLSGQRFGVRCPGLCLWYKAVWFVAPIIHSDSKIRVEISLKSPAKFILLLIMFFFRWAEENEHLLCLQNLNHSHQCSKTIVTAFGTWKEMG